MNILYIFGNGFDKAQGMATSYPEFYKYLQEHVTSSSNLLNQMKAEITEDRKLWSDMEERLGAFTDVSNNADEFYDFYFELNEHLQSYLTKENEKFLPTDKLKMIASDQMYHSYHFEMYRAYQNEMYHLYHFQMYRLSRLTRAS